MSLSVQPLAGKFGRCDNQQMDRITLRFDGGDTRTRLGSNQNRKVNKMGHVCHEPV